MDYGDARSAIVASIRFASGALNDTALAKAEAAAENDVEFSTLEFDSLATMEFCMELEDKVGIEIDLGDLAAHRSINALATYIASRKSGE